MKAAMRGLGPGELQGDVDRLRGDAAPLLVENEGGAELLVECGFEQY